MWEAATGYNLLQQILHVTTAAMATLSVPPSSATVPQGGGATFTVQGTSSQGEVQGGTARLTVLEAVPTSQFSVWVEPATVAAPEGSTAVVTVRTAVTSGAAQPLVLAARELGAAAGCYAGGMLAVLALLLAAPSNTPPAVELHRATCGSVTAIWTGEKVDETAGKPEYGVATLEFTFGKSPRRFAFKPRGELFFDDWSFAIFSPDCRRVLLKHDHHGPYHIVPLGRLRDYLTRKRPAPRPEAAVQYSVRSGGMQRALVHRDAKWLDAATIEYAACDEECLVFERKLRDRGPGKQVRTVPAK